ncbi:MAG: pilin N-terminal domain-containing protein [Alkalibacterium sp.]|uniref:SpaA isopeptide-forming pilin-related protein n=1 Tax=Alkalibacterium sp. TaxID=1872447 RepID=UPI000EE2C4DE|nr:SpaA isopeptide-forming pilin-related protein [Alkalibacterium sp.]MDN6294179.1 pilin N-terminal domain-containing protein [Alkalibacterium sp.]MDN6295813.1 pilin N-terminal domain-containing protein [Alkalibacterium sp.]HAJ70069.1 hypothetical protein [Alkalibacterium sp.]
MTKNIRKIFGFLLGLFMFLSVMVPSLAMAEEAMPSGNARPEIGNLHIHKLQFNYDPLDHDKITNDGLSQTVPSDSAPLEGVEFTIYPVDDEVTLDNIDSDFLTGGNSLTTDANGLALFNNLPAGRYYVEETDTPKGVEEFSAPFLVDVPMMNPEGTGWNSDVHIYPKNQLILGTAKLTKFAEDGETKLANAVFSLYKEGDGSDELISSGLTTDTAGIISVGGLVVGNYYYMETSAPDGYGLDQTPIRFEVTKDDHAYSLGNDLGNLDPSKMISDGIELVNNDLPEIDKSITEQGQEMDTGDFFENLSWVIRSDVPTFIDTENPISYVIKDTFGPELTYAGNLVVEADGAAFTDFTASGVTDGQEGGTLELDFDIDALDGVDELVITFDTYLNENAVMGRDYENNVELNYNNGFEVYVDTEENPPVVHTGGKAFEKVNQDGEGLAGAEFVIYNSDGLYLQEDYSWGDEFSAWTFVSDGDGYFEIKGLAYGNYYLKETKAPEVNGVQYRLLDDDYEFTVDTNSYYSIVSDYVPARPAGIENRPEISLPQTGGMGTLVFSIIGLGLMGTSVKLYKKSEK